MASNKSKKMHFQWNYSEDAIVERLGFGKDLNKKFAETLLKYAEPYTPKKSGALRRSATVTANRSNAKITYPGISYAQYQYFADDSGWNRTTPLTRSKWLEYAWTIHKFQIAGTVGAYRRWNCK